MYRTRLLKEIEEWARRGLIAPPLADQLSADVRARVRGFSFASALGILAAVLLSAAILTFVAANWEGVPRLWRLALIAALVAAGPMAGALLEARGSRAFAEGARLIGSASFGAGIALVAQMYHLSGDEADAILVWCLGVGVAAALTRSPVLTIASILLAASYLVVTTELFGRSVYFPWWYPSLLAALWGVAIWTDSVGARRLVFLALIHFGFHLWIEADTPVVVIAMLGLSGGLFAAATAWPAQVDAGLRLGGAARFLAFVGFAVALFLLHWQFADEMGPFLAIAVLGLAGSIAALWSAGSDDRSLRIAGYVLFSVEVVLVYFITVGSLIGTAAFFLSAGVALAVAAFVILRLERRMARREAGGAA